MMPLNASRLLRVSGAMAFLVIASSTGVAEAEAPYPVEWTRQIGNAGSGVWNHSVAVDSLGNAYISGYTEDSLDGNGGTNDAFLIKYDPTGSTIWTRQIGASDTDWSYAVAVDPWDNVYTSGYTEGGLDGQTYVGMGDAFLTKYDSAGNKLWTQQSGSTASEASKSVAVDSQGNTYISGYTWGDLDGNTNAGKNDAFLTKYDSMGNKLWTQQIGTAERDISESVAVDALGNVYISGYTEGGIDGNTHAGMEDAFLIKYDSTGNKLWSRQVGANYRDEGYSVAIDGQGNVYTTGYTFNWLDGSATIDTIDVAFLVKYDPLGNVLWTQHTDPSTADFGYSVATDALGYTYVLGTNSFGIDANSFDVDVFLSKYDPSGNVLWTQQFGTPEQDIGQSVAVDPSGNVYISGYTHGSFDGSTSTTGTKTFLIKLTAPIPEPASLALLAVGGLTLLHNRR